MHESDKTAMLAKTVYFTAKVPDIMGSFTCCSVKYLSIIFKYLGGGCVNAEDYPDLASTTFVLPVP